jgi:hypothetical protein
MTKVVPFNVFGPSVERPAQPVDISTHTFGVLKVVEADSKQAALAVEFGAALSQAEDELFACQEQLRSQYARYAEAEEQATKLNVGKDAPPVGRLMEIVVFSAVFALELGLSGLAMAAITF